MLVVCFEILYFLLEICAIFPAVKPLLKLVKIWRSCHHWFRQTCFLEHTVYSWILL